MALVMLDSLNSGSAVEAPRRKVVVLLSSNSALALPSWCVPGKGLLRVSGCGGGGGGGSGNDVYRGGGGGSAASAHEATFIVPKGTTSLNVQIGVNGTRGVFGDAGTDGGDTVLMANGIGAAQGAYILSLGGGGGGRPASATSDGYGGNAGILKMGNALSWSTVQADGGDINGTVHHGRLIQTAWLANNFRLTPGSQGGKYYRDNTSGGDFALAAFGFIGARTSTHGASGPFGAGSSATGQAAMGFGAGGMGGMPNGAGSDGSPGFMIIEFIEGL